MLAGPFEIPFQTLCIPYLLARGVQDPDMARSLVSQDIDHILQGLSLLFDENSADILKHLLGDHLSLIDGFTVPMDHVGRELYGPLSFYLPLLREMAPQSHLTYVGDFVFPSIGVVKMLRERDPHLKGVTIGKVYFQRKGGKAVNLELFQAAPLSEKDPQPISATVARLSLLNGSIDTPGLVPIDHTAFRIESKKEIQAIHQRILDGASETLAPGLAALSFNPNDGTLHTKALLRDSPIVPFNRIIEFVHYEKGAGSLANFS